MIPFFILSTQAGEGLFDIEAIRDTSTLEVKVLGEWTVSKKEPGVRQKLIEITVCEWWSGQKVRLPVTLNAPADGSVCRNVVVANQGLAESADYRKRVGPGKRHVESDGDVLRKHRT